MNITFNELLHRMVVSGEERQNQGAGRTDLRGGEHPVGAGSRATGILPTRRSGWPRRRATSPGVCILADASATLE